jgi:hypothetical protein
LKKNQLLLLKSMIKISFQSQGKMLKKLMFKELHTFQLKLPLKILMKLLFLFTLINKDQLIHSHLEIKLIFQLQLFQKFMYLYSLKRIILFLMYPQLNQLLM